MDLDLGQAWRNSVDKIGGWAEAVVEMLPEILAAILVLVLFWIVAVLVRKGVRNLLARVSAYREVNRLLATVGFFVVLGVGFLVALGVLDLSKTVTSLLAGAGIVGLALGFAFQDTAENFICGVLLSIRRPFREGDIVESNDHMGVVEEINLRSTLIRTFQGQVVYVPNRIVYQNPLTNYSQPGYRRVDLACGVAYGDDLERARDVSVSAIESLDARDADRPVEFFYEEFGGSSINFVVRFWLDFRKQTDWLAARSEAIIALKKALDDAGLTIPFPITTLDFGVVGGRSLAEEAPRLAEGEPGS